MIRIIVQIFLGYAVYIVLSHIFKIEAMGYVKDKLIGKIKKNK